MKYKLLENLSLAITILLFGVMAGFFWTYTFNVNLATLRLDGSTYAIVQSLFNENVRHAMFFIFFFGAGALSILAVVLNYKHVKSVDFWFMVTASVVYVLGVIAFTSQVNLPLNYYTESWNPADLPLDWEATRIAWNEANAIRVGTSFISLLLSVSALCIRATR